MRIAKIAGIVGTALALSLTAMAKDAQQGANEGQFRQCFVGMIYYLSIIFN